jgi:hypothetical protein
MSPPMPCNRPVRGASSGAPTGRAAVDGPGHDRRDQQERPHGLRADGRARRGAERIDHDRDHERKRDRDDAETRVVELAIPEPQRRHDGPGAKKNEEHRADCLGQQPTAEIGCHAATTLLKRWESNT